MADHRARVADWLGERTDSEQELTRLGAQISDLQESVRQQMALAPAARVLNVISQNTATSVKQAGTREDTSEKLDAELVELISAVQARQEAIEDGMKALVFPEKYKVE